jgi:hypothetical protein
VSGRPVSPVTRRSTRSETGNASAASAAVTSSVGALKSSPWSVTARANPTSPATRVWVRPSPDVGRDLEQRRRCCTTYAEFQGVLVTERPYTDGSVPIADPDGPSVASGDSIGRAQDPTLRRPLC